MKTGDEKSDEKPKNEPTPVTPKAMKAKKVTTNPLTKVYFRAPASSEPSKLHWSVAISTTKVQNERSDKRIDALTFIMGHV